MMLKKIELSEYFNNLEYDFRETVFRHIEDKLWNGDITLYGNEYCYVDSECDGVVRVSYKTIRLEEDHIIVDFTQKDESGNRLDLNMNIRSMSTDMIMDMVQNI